MSTIANAAIAPRQKLSDTTKYLIALIIGVIVGHNYVPDIVIGYTYMAFGVVVVFFSFYSSLDKFLSYLPYLIYTEIYVRGNALFVFNLYAEYVLLASFALLVLKQGTLVTLRSRSFVFISLYALIELIDVTRTNEPDFARVNVVNSFSLALVSFWSASNIISTASLNIFLKNLKIAAIYLTGVVLAAHLFGHINYGAFSSFESTNGLAPVQISGYLGTGSILFFLSIFNDQERKDLPLNVAMFIICTSIVILSFSRGGLYFIAIIAFLFFLFNYKKASNYGLLLLVIPIGIGIYYYVIAATGGAIIERYQQEGSSGRDILIEIGFKIFLSDPIAGIGTGNFSKEIVTRGLYNVESGAHNEFVRAAAEHGVLGILTYWGFYIYVFVELFMLRTGVFRQYAIYFFVLFCLIIVHNGLKISLQPVLLIFVICTPVITRTTAKRTKTIAPPLKENPPGTAT